MDPNPAIEQLIDLALAEDIRSGDITTQTLIPAAAMTSARFFMKQSGLVAGLPFLETLFRKIDPEISIKLTAKEGSYLKAGAAIASIIGPVRAILTGERVALNLLQHASGVATTTASYVRKVSGLNCSILDTRKTLPGLRALEKYAVRVGGGVNHRYALDDRLVIKNSHLSFLANSASRSISQAVTALKERRPDLPIEIEIDDIDLIDEVLETEVVAIMLSNMLPGDIAHCVEKIKRTNKKVYLESAGTITLDTIGAYAETGVDGISIGDLTHSVKALDIGLIYKETSTPAGIVKLTKKGANP